MKDEDHDIDIAFPSPIQSVALVPCMIVETEDGAIWQFDGEWRRVDEEGDR